MFYIVYGNIRIRRINEKYFYIFILQELIKKRQSEINDNFNLKIKSKKDCRQWSLK